MEVCVVLHVSPAGYAKRLYSTGFSNFDVGVGLQLLVMPEYDPAFTSTPTRRDIPHTYVATIFFWVVPRNDGESSSLVARMERSAIRGASSASRFPDFASASSGLQVSRISRESNAVGKEVLSRCRGSRPASFTGISVPHFAFKKQPSDACELRSASLKRGIKLVSRHVTHLRRRRCDPRRVVIVPRSVACLGFFPAICK